MFSFALPRGRGSVYSDLPPTLQPGAIAAAAARPDHLRTAALSGLVYLMLGGAALAFSALAPRSVLPPIHFTGSGRTVVIEGPTTPAVLRPGPAPSVMPAASTQATAGAPVVAQTAVPDQPAAGLATEDHHADPMGAGAGPSASQASTGVPAVALVTGLGVHDFSMVGLAVLQRVDPLYPEFARRARIQGPVVLLMTVDERGLPIQVQVLEGHPVFHEAALQAARRWRFEPARSEGQPVSASFRLTLKFSLR